MRIYIHIATDWTEHYRSLELLVTFILYISDPRIHDDLLKQSHNINGQQVDVLPSVSWSAESICWYIHIDMISVLPRCICPTLNKLVLCIYTEVTSTVARWQRWPIITCCFTAWMDFLCHIASLEFFTFYCWYNMCCLHVSCNYEQYQSFSCNENLFYIRHTAVVMEL